MANNIFETITPVKPKVLAEERLYVYVPKATTTTKGIASYDSKDFELPSGVVKLKRNNPFETEALVKLNAKDFVRTDGVVKMVWPIAGEASAETGNTNGYGLVKIKSNGYLKFENGELDADYDKFKTDLEENVKPTYGGRYNGFADYNDYVDMHGLARKDADGNILLKLSKDAIGLDKVENKAFNEYVYDDFSDNIKTKVATLLEGKVDKTTWNRLFSDWADKNAQITTPHSWLEYLDAEQKSLRDSIGTASLFLGFFETLDQLLLAHPAGVEYEKSLAYITATKTYWAIRQTADGYEWYDTYIDDGTFYERMETDVSALRPNGLVGSIGSSGKWVQSDHVHPSDTRKVDKTLLQSMNLTVTSNIPSGNDFNVKFWNKNASGAYAENPLTDLTINIPYVRTSKYLHNWAGSLNQFLAPKNETYWAASAAEFDNLDMNSIPNGSLLIVDDGEDAEPGAFVNIAQLDRQGIEVDSLSPERFIITEKDIDLKGLVLTVDVNSNKYKTVGLALTHPNTAGHDPLIVVKPRANGNTIAEKYFKANKLLTFEIDGTPIETMYNSNNVLRTSDGDNNNILPTNRLLITVDGNKVSTFNTGTIENKVIVTDGAEGIKAINLEPNKIVMTGSNGQLSYFDMSVANVGKVIGVSANGTPTLVSQTEIPTSLPVMSFTTNPTVAQANTALVFADPEGKYIDGCLYLY